MSWLTKDWRALTAWLGSIETPASRVAASSAAGALSDGLNKVEAAGELIIVDAANAALALVPAGLGLAFAPAVDNLLIGIATKILGKHSSPAAALAQVSAGLPSPAGSSLAPGEIILTPHPQVTMAPIANPNPTGAEITAAAAGG